MNYSFLFGSTMRMSTVESARLASPAVPRACPHVLRVHWRIHHPTVRSPTDRNKGPSRPSQGAPDSSTAFDNATFGVSQEDPTVPPHQLAAIMGQLNSRLQDLLDREVEDLAQHQQPPPNLREQQPPQHGGFYSAETTTLATHPSKGNKG